jgi:predicted HTH domain antitoxin
MKAVEIEIPKDIILSLKMPQTKIKEWLTQELALTLYAEGYLSFGKARKLAGLSKWEFVEVKSFLDNLRIQAHFRIHQRLYETVLAEMGELS